MSEATKDGGAAGARTRLNVELEGERQQALLKAGALQNAILTSANFSIIATDENGIIRLHAVTVSSS